MRALVPLPPSSSSPSLPAARMARLPGLGALATLSFVLTVGAACSPNAVCKLMGPINDPSNRTMRRDILDFGLGEFCKQMTSHNAPLKLAPDAPVIGRFYPQHCTQETMPNGDLRVAFDGMGYAFTNVSRKVTFRSSAALQYDQDFKCADDNSIYAYFDTRTAAPPTFQLLQIEQPMANLVQGWIAPFANNFGTQMVSGELARGFTVIRGDDGNVDFDVGHLPLGQRPRHPFDVHGTDRTLVESQRTQVFPSERDFIGPFEVKGSGRALYLTMQLDGQQALGVVLLPKTVGDQELGLYINYGPVGPLRSPPLFADVLRYGVQYQRAVPVSPGMYYVVIDNMPIAGQTAPAGSLFGLGDQAAVVNYAIQIGDAP